MTPAEFWIGGTQISLVLATVLAFLYGCAYCAAAFTMEKLTGWLFVVAVASAIFCGGIVLVIGA